MDAFLATRSEARMRLDSYREYQLALMQATETCKKQEPSCRGGKYGPPSPRRAETPPIYSTDRLNRSDGPEDRSLAERCLGAVLPDFSGYRRIVQSPTSVAIFYDTGQGQGWQRTIPVNGSPHLPVSGSAAVRRFARPVGGQNAGRRRHQFRSRRQTFGDRASTCTSSNAGRGWMPPRSNTS